MPITVYHSLTATTPDNTSYEIRPSHWNSVHAITANLSGTEISNAFSNANGISFGTNAQSAITGSYTVPSTAGLLSAVNVSAGNTSNNLSALTFSNSNGISFGLSGSTVTATVATNYAGTGTSATNASITLNTNGLAISVGAGGAFSAGVSTGGNTSGNTGVTGTRVVLAGGNNITVSQGTDANGATITISGPNVGGAQTGISSVAAQGGTQTVGMVSFINSNGITFGMSTGANTGSVTASYTVPVVTNSSWTVSDANTSATVGRLAFTNSNGLTLSLSTSNNGNHTVIGSYTVPTVTNSSMTVSDAATSGTLARLAFTNLNGVTLSLSTGAGGSHTIVGSHNALTSQSNQAFSAQGGSSAFQTLIFTNSNNVSFSNTAGSVWGSFALNVSATGGTSNALSGLTFKDSNGVSFGLSTGAGVGTITATVAAQSTQSAIKGLGASNTGNTAGNTGISTGIDWVFAGTNNITVSESTAGGGPNTLWISGPTVGGAQTGISSVAASGGTQTVGMVSFINSNGITFGMSTGANTGSITASYTVPTQTNQTVGLYASSQTTASASSYTFDARSISIIGAGGLSVGMNSTSAGGTTTGLVLSAPPVSGLYGVNGISISTNSNSISISGLGFTGSEFEPEIYGNTATISQPNGTAFFRPFYPNGYYDVNRIEIFQWHSTQSNTTFSVSVSVSSQTSSGMTGSWGQSGTFGLFSRKNTAQKAADYSNILSFKSGTYSYSYGVSAAVSWSTNASSVTGTVTTTGAGGFINAIDTAGGVTTSSSSSSSSTTFSSTSTNQNSFSTSFTNTYGSVLFSGIRPNFFPMASMILTPGDYWLMHIQSSTSGQTNNTRFDRLCAQIDGGIIWYQTSNQGYLRYGDTAAEATSNLKFGLGSYSSSGNTTTTVALTAITSVASNASMYFIAHGQTL